MRCAEWRLGAQTTDPPVNQSLLTLGCGHRRSHVALSMQLWYPSMLPCREIYWILQSAVLCPRTLIYCWCMSFQSHFSLFCDECLLISTFHHTARNSQVSLWLKSIKNNEEHRTDRRPVVAGFCTELFSVCTCTAERYAACSMSSPLLCTL